MTILLPGTFRVSDYRKKIPVKVKRAVRARYQEDHRPPLCDRPFDTEADDFDPPQHDPEHIFLVEKPKHDEHTFGRKAGADKTVTTRGSDVGERARVRRIARSEAEHRGRMAAKQSKVAVIPDIKSLMMTPEEREQFERKVDREIAACFTGRGRKKRKIPSRPFPKGHRPLRDRGR